MTGPGAYLWLNEALIPAAEARVSVMDRGFLYGDGFFETLRVEDGRPWFLEEHLARLAASARAFNLPWPPAVPWRERLTRLLQANKVDTGPAAVKIILTRGETPALGLPAGAAPTLIISARPYEPPPPQEYAGGWPVVYFPERRTTFLGRHKSLNYLFYLAARQYALDQGAKEALILEADGSVSEGAATSLILRKDGEYFTPQAPSALPGVTLKALSRGLARQGPGLRWVPLRPPELEEAQGLWLANSLMGLMPVASLAGRVLRVEPGLTKALNAILTAAALRF